MFSHNKKEVVKRGTKLKALSKGLKQDAAKPNPGIGK